MPSIVCRSRIRAASEHCILSLDVRHHLATNSVGSNGLKETRFPDNVDILLTSNLVISLSGCLDGEEISAQELYASELAQSLVAYFQLNAAELGLNYVSQLKLDENNENLTVVLTSSRQNPLDPQMLPAHLLLVAIDLCYSWKTPETLQTKTDRANHPFSERLSLPYKAVLDNVVRRFATWQLVKRYPLIFGRWCQQLDMESAYFQGVADSIMRILRRSQNKSFRSKCQRLIKLIRTARISAQIDARKSLSMSLGAEEDEDVVTHYLTDQDVLCYALERVFRDGMSRPQFKGLAILSSTDAADDEELACHHDDHPPQEAPTSMCSSESFLWNEVFKDVLMATSPSSTGYLDLPSDGENELPIDNLFDRHHQTIFDEEDGYDDLPALDSIHKFEELSLQPWPKFGSNAPQVVDDTTAPQVLDWDDSDDEIGFHNSQTTSHTTRPDDLVFSSDFRLLNSHLDHDRVSPDQDSQDEVFWIPEKESESQATSSVSSLLVYKPGLLSNREENSMEQIHSMDYWTQSTTSVTKVGGIFPAKSIQTIPIDVCTGDSDLEVDFLSDGAYHDDIVRMNSSIQPSHKSFENTESGDSVEVVARTVFSETTFSHRGTTLNITCPWQAECEYHLRHTPDAMEDSDEEFWNAETHGGDLLGAESNEAQFTMVELDHLAS